MARVGQRNTGPEIKLRSALHRRGLRYRVNVRALSGTPDLVFPARKACVFVNGCFWHRHGCRRSTMPTANREFWEAKFAANVARDARKEGELRAAGWRVLRVWECALSGRDARPLDEVADDVIAWLQSDAVQGDVGGSRSDLAEGR